MTPALVVDTNVLEHAFNPIVNGDGHVHRLLKKFTEQRKGLCLDQPAEGRKSRILEEYSYRLQHHLKAMSEDGQLTQWLRYVTIYAERKAIRVDFGDELGRKIAALMRDVGAESTDRVFVYVACKLDSIMVSNNATHVTDLRTELRRAARKVRSRDTDFMPSDEAESKM